MLKQLLEQLNYYLRVFQEDNSKLYEAIFTDEAEEQLIQLEEPYKSRISEAIGIFEQIGTKYKNINSLGNGLYEIKPKDVRAYFRYHKDKRKIIIIGFVCLKKTQKAPKQNIEQANKNIQKYYNNERNI